MAIKGKTVERNLSFEITYRGMGLRALARPNRNESSKAGFDFREFKHHASQMDSKKKLFFRAYLYYRYNIFSYYAFN